MVKKCFTPRPLQAACIIRIHDAYQTQRPQSAQERKTGSDAEGRRGLAITFD
jgi:hypothetical protein